MRDIDSIIRDNAKAAGVPPSQAFNDVPKHDTSKLPRTVSDYLPTADNDNEPFRVVSTPDPNCGDLGGFIWRVQNSKGVDIAACPSMPIAQQIADALNETCSFIEGCV